MKGWMDLARVIWMRVVVAGLAPKAAITILNGFVLIKLWEWFILPAFGVSAPTFPVATGCVLVANLVTQHVYWMAVEAAGKPTLSNYHVVSDTGFDLGENPPASQREWVHAKKILLTLAITRPLGYLVIGYLIHILSVIW